MDDDTYDAQCAQREQEERRRHEDEVFNWALRSMRSFQQQTNEWYDEFIEKNRSIENGDHSI